jgi:hypothetical protein
MRKALYTSAAVLLFLSMTNAELEAYPTLVRSP